VSPSVSTFCQREAIEAHVWLVEISGITDAQALIKAYAEVRKKNLLEDNIVYQRLEKDFASNRIFHELPLIPPEWKGAFSPEGDPCRGEATEPESVGNPFSTPAIQQLIRVRETISGRPENAVESDPR